jgi:Ca-activated chloride channel family protein
MVQWYYARHGQTFGPFTPEQLRELARDGKLLPNDLVSKPGAAKWVPANTIPGLFPSNGGVQVPPPVSPARPDAPWFANPAPASPARPTEPAALPARPERKPAPLTPISVEKSPSLLSPLLALPKPVLFGLFGGVGGLLGALLLGELLWLFLSPRAAQTRPPLQVAVPASVPVYSGGSNRFTIKVARTGFKGPVGVHALQPAEGITIPDVEVSADKDEADVEVAVSDRLPNGKTSVTIEARTPDEKVKPVTAKMDLNVEPMPPALAVSASPKVQVDQGGTGRFTVRIARARFNGDVTLRFAGLPGGVSLREQTIPNDKTEKMVDLDVPESCAVGKSIVTVEASSGSAIAGSTKFELEVRHRPPPMADIVFVLDLTGSMQFAINGIKEGIQSFTKELERNKIDARLGVICFRDLEVDKVEGTNDPEHPYPLLFDDQPFTKDYTAVRNGVAPLRAGGGGDIPESSLQAMALAARQPFRAKASRVLVLITDAEPKIHQLGALKEGEPQTMEQTLDILKKKEIDQVHLVVRSEDLRNFARPDRSYQNFHTDADGKRVFAGEHFELKNVTGDKAFAGILPSISKSSSRSTIAGKPKDSGTMEPPPLPKAAEVPVLKALQSNDVYAKEDKLRLLAAFAVWTMVVAGFISLFIVAGQHFHTRQALVDPIDGGKGFGGGLLAGMVGGGVGQLVFQTLTEGTLGSSAGAGWVIILALSRIAGWGLLGGLIGLGMAFAVPNLKVLRGLAGGVVGGIFGALAFVVVTLILGKLLSGYIGDALGRWTGAAILGFCIGLMVALAELAFRRWWLEVAVSAREVRTVTLGSAVVTLGGDEKVASFFIAGAPAIALRYRLQGEKVLCEDEMTGQSFEVEPGDRRTIGKVTVTVCSPASSKKTGYSLQLSNGKTVVLQEGMPLTADDLPGLQAKGTDGIVALVNRPPTLPNQITLRNRSAQSWAVRNPNGGAQVVEPGRGVELAGDVQINFGAVQATLILDSAARR